MSDVALTINEEVVKPIIESKIQAAIVEALSSDGEGLVERVVAEALMRKIEPERYSSKKVPWIEHVCHNVIRESAEAAIQEWAKSHKEKITAEFVRQLSSRKTSSAVVKAMIEGLAAVAGSTWKFSVDVRE